MEDRSVGTVFSGSKRTASRNALSRSGACSFAGLNLAKIKGQERIFVDVEGKDGFSWVRLLLELKQAWFLVWS